MNALHTAYALTLALLVSCSAPQLGNVPRPIPVPVRHSSADTGPIGVSVSKVDKKLVEAQRIAERLERELGKLQEAARKASAQADSAFSKGLVAGSIEAANLRDSVDSVERDLAETKGVRNKLAYELGGAKGELVVSRREVGVLSVDLALMRVDLDLAYGALELANAEIGSAASTITRLNGDALSAKTKLDNANKWKWRFFKWGLLSTLTIGAYLALRLHPATRLLIP